MFEKRVTHKIFWLVESASKKEEKERLGLVRLENAAKGNNFQQRLRIVWVNINTGWKSNVKNQRTRSWGLFFFFFFSWSKVEKLKFGHETCAEQNGLISLFRRFLLAWVVKWSCERAFHRIHVRFTRALHLGKAHNYILQPTPRVIEQMGTMQPANHLFVFFRFFPCYLSSYQRELSPAAFSTNKNPTNRLTLYFLAVLMNDGVWSDFTRAVGGHYWRDSARDQLPPSPYTNAIECSLTTSFF